MTKCGNDVPIWTNSCNETITYHTEISVCDHRDSSFNTKTKKRENELVKALEVIEIEGDEKLSDLEKKAKNVNDVVESKELQNKELELRLAQLESELEKVSSNYPNV